MPALRAGAWSFYIFHAGAAAAEPASAGLPEGLTRPAVYGWGTENIPFPEPAYSGLPVGFSQPPKISQFGTGNNIIAVTHRCDNWR